jgi:NADH-ubiquinone oxidoreductase chain 5
MDFAFLYVPVNQKKYFYVFFYGFSLSMFLLIFIPSIFTLLLAWDGLAIFRFFLIVYYGKFSSFSSGLYVYLLQRLGDAFFVVCIGSLFFVFGHFENSYSSITNILISVFFFLALITKSANFPFNSWLPLAMAAPTPVSALVHSSTLVTAGVYLLIRYKYIIEEISFLILVCSILTGLGGRFWACFESDLKKIIAYSTTANLGFMTFSLALGNINGAFVHLILHACFKALLFVSVGHFLYISHMQDVRSVSSFFYISKLLS